MPAVPVYNRTDMKQMQCDRRNLYNSLDKTHLTVPFVKPTLTISSKSATFILILAKTHILRTITISITHGRRVIFLCV
jgi:hypothetical protein